MSCQHKHRCVFDNGHIRQIEMNDVPPLSGGPERATIPTHATPLSPRPSDAPMKMPVVVRLGLAMLTICLLAACAGSRLGGSDDAKASTEAPSATGQRSTSASPGPSSDNLDNPSEVPEAVWAAIVEALERQVDGELDPSAVELVSIDGATWNDGSLGCAKPGEVYTQALVEGFRVVVEIDDEEFDYRVPRDGEPRLCESRLPSGG